MTSGRPISHEKSARSQRCLPGIFCQSCCLCQPASRWLSLPHLVLHLQPVIRCHLSVTKISKVTYHYCIRTRFSNPSQNSPWHDQMTEYILYYNRIDPTRPNRGCHAAGQSECLTQMSHSNLDAHKKKAQILLWTPLFSCPPPNGKKRCLPSPSKARSAHFTWARFPKSNFSPL